MHQAEPQTRIVLLGAAPPLGELIASYIHHEFRGAAVQQCASAADFDRSHGEPSAFVLIEPCAPTSVHSIARAVGCLRALGAEAPILVAAASPNPAAAAEALRCGAQGFVPDVVPISALTEALRMVLTRKTCFAQTIRLVSKSDLRGRAGATPRHAMWSPRRVKAAD